jgi:hypothetical protein
VDWGIRSAEDLREKVLVSALPCAEKGQGGEAALSVALQAGIGFQLRKCESDLRSRHGPG